MSRLLPVVWLLTWAWSPLTVRAESVEGVRDAAEVQTTVRDVLSDPEYRHLFRDETRPEEDNRLPGWLKRFLDWLFARNRPVQFGKPWLNLVDVLFYCAMAILAVVIVVLLISLWKWMEAPRLQASQTGSSDEEAINPTSPPGDVPANEYERRALAAARSGDFRTALRELVLGSMSWTERAGLIRYRRGLVNRDYVRAVWRRLPQRESLLLIVAAFERVFYGRRTADAPTFDACLQEFRNSFSLEATDAHPAG